MQAIEFLTGCGCRVAESFPSGSKQLRRFPLSGQILAGLGLADFLATVVKEDGNDGSQEGRLHASLVLGDFLLEVRQVVVILLEDLEHQTNRKLADLTGDHRVR